MGKKIIIITALLFLLTGIIGHQGPVQAQGVAEELYNNSGLPIPRFVSLRRDKVFVRTGPAQRYPIKWVYKRENMPVEIIQEFDTWRKIRDRDGEEGWIHQSLLSGKRYAIIHSDMEAYMFKKPVLSARKVAQIENGGLVAVEKCQSAWCFVEVDGFSGWIQRKSLWGVYATEELD